MLLEITVINAYTLSKLSVPFRWHFKIVKQVTNEFTYNQLTQNKAMQKQWLWEIQAFENLFLDGSSLE